MLPALLILSTMLVTDEASQRSLKAAEQHNFERDAIECVTRNAYRFARYTEESAPVVARNAAYACAGKIKTAGKGNALALSRKLEVTIEHSVIDWRSRSGQRGSAAYEEIRAEIDSQFCTIDCRNRKTAD